jgi:CRISPR-associated exonuclease Cas4
MPGERPPPWSDDHLVTIFALEHRSYRPRRCALICIDQAWDENLDTLRGRRAHEKVGAPDAGRRRRASTVGGA